MLTKYLLFSKFSFFLVLKVLGHLFYVTELTSVDLRWVKFKHLLRSSTRFMHFGAQTFSQNERAKRSTQAGPMHLVT